MGLFKIKSRSSMPDTNSDSVSMSSASLKSPTSVSHGRESLHSTEARASSPVPDIPLPPRPHPDDDPVIYLKSIYAVRDRTRSILDLAKKGQLKHFDVDQSMFKGTASYVVSVIKRDYAPDYASIPPHGRWQHFEVGGRPRVTELLKSWTGVDAKEQTRRLLDLFLVSVLLDAGAGPEWSYVAKDDGRKYNRSEGLAVASLDMFKAGMFSSDPSQLHRVDARGLSLLTAESIGTALQVSTTNKLEGLEGRTQLLVRLGKAVTNREYFGSDRRPGEMLDYLLTHSATKTIGTPIVPVPVLWQVLMDGLGPIWPASRTQINNKSVGDAWPCDALPSSDNPADRIIPFHKLTQWLCYSLMVPMTKLLQVRFAGVDLMTGLAEYRNGGLFIDMGLLTLKPEDTKRGLEAYHLDSTTKGQARFEVVPAFKPDDDVIVEWRALTVAYLDELLVEVNAQLGLAPGQKLTLAQMLEAGSWKGGREIAEVTRPNTKGPPIMLLSDGTVF